MTKKVMLWGGPLDGLVINVPSWEPSLVVPDPTQGGLGILYWPTSKMKGQARIYRLAQDVGC